MNILKKGMLGLLLVCLCACSNDESLVAQNKPKPKTVKEMLCREWHLDETFRGKKYTQTDIFGITFYNNHTFEFIIDTAMQNSVKIVKGKWEFETSAQENAFCYDENNLCYTDIKIKLVSENIFIGGYYDGMFDGNNYSEIAKLYADTLIIYPPRYNHHDNRILLFSIIK
jgi:hypothetical protein